MQEGYMEKYNYLIFFQIGNKVLNLSLSLTHNSYYELSPSVISITMYVTLPNIEINVCWNHIIIIFTTSVYTEAMEDYDKVKDKNDPNGFEAYSYQPIYILQKAYTST